MGNLRFAATMFCTPARAASSLEMTEPVRFTASLHEEAYDADPDTKNPAVFRLLLWVFASGDVTAEVIYAHSGNPEDYDLLRKNGISVKAKIALVRYSKSLQLSRKRRSPRSVKRRRSAHLFRSREDGYTKGKVFPDGPWGPESHIQRARSTYDYIVPGIPPRPAGHRPRRKTHRAEEGARSLRENSRLLPLSWRDASRFWKI